MYTFISNFINLLLATVANSTPPPIIAAASAASTSSAASKGASVPLAPEMVEDYNIGSAGSLKKVKRKSPRIRGSSSTGNVEKRPQQPQQPVKEALSPSVAESIRAVFAVCVRVCARVSPPGPTPRRSNFMCS